MCVTMQRDLFAVGARLADPSHQIAARVDKADDGDAQWPGSKAGSMNSTASCRRCAISSSPAAAIRRRPAPGARGVPAGRAGRLRLGHEAVEPVVHHLPESRIGPALHDGAGRESSRRRQRDAVVSHIPDLQASYAACERLARTHYENFPVASRLLPSRAEPARGGGLCLCPHRRRYRRRTGPEPNERLACSLNATGSG